MPGQNDVTSISRGSHGDFLQLVCSHSWENVRIRRSKICLSVNYILNAHGGRKAHSRNFKVIAFHALIETRFLFLRKEQSPVI